MSESCPLYSEATLSDYMDKALSPIARLRVCRHLSCCGDCTARVAALEALSHAARSLHGVTTEITEPAHPAPRQYGLPIRPLLVGAAAVVAAGMWFAPEMPGRPRVAFADVENAMRQIKTAHWTETTIAYEKDGTPSFYIVTECWARMNPPALARHQSSYFSREDIHRRHPVRESAVLMTSDGTLTQEAGRDWYRRLPDPRHPVRQIIQQALFSPDAVPYAKALSAGAWVRQSSPDNSAVYRFQRITEKQTLRDAQKLSQEIWADVKTKRVTRRVVKYSWAGTMMTAKGRIRLPLRPPITMTAENFRYDEALPKGVFGLTPPPGVKIKILQPLRDR